MNKPEKLDLRSHDAAGDKIAQRMCLFPDIRTDGGKLDFDRLQEGLRQALAC